MKTRAFTLIEVMVVLSILAIIAILAYNFFGNTMKEAKLKQRVTEVYNDFRVLGDATELYIAKYGTTPTIGGLALDDLVSSGLLKTAPNNPWSTGGWTLWENMIDVGGTATNDLVWTNDVDVSAETDEHCKEINRLHTSLGATIPAWPSYPANAPIACMLDEGNVFVYPVQIK